MTGIPKQFGQVPGAEADRGPGTPAAGESPSTYQVQVVERALQLLTLVADRQGLTLTELARRSGNSKARTFRLLHTLEAAGFILRKGSEPGFRLGYQALRLGVRAAEQIDLVRVAQPVVEAIGHRCDETVQLRVRDGRDSMCICRWETDKIVRYHTEVGRRVPLHAGSGRLLLAFAPAELQREVLAAPLMGFTPNTPVNTEQLARELAEIRKEDLCVSQGELEAGAISAGAAVRDATGEVVAVFIVAAPIARVPEARLAELVALAREGAAAVTRGLGG
jgi:IclR family transcriptional regulator, KDG regulon repressor